MLFIKYSGLDMPVYAAREIENSFMAHTQATSSFGMAGFTTYSARDCDKCHVALKCMAEHQDWPKMFAAQHIFADLKQSVTVTRPDLMEQLWQMVPDETMDDVAAEQRVLVLLAC